MKVAELILRLQRMPQDKTVEVDATDVEGGDWTPAHVGVMGDVVMIFAEDPEQVKLAKLFNAIEAAEPSRSDLMGYLQLLIEEGSITREELERYYLKNWKPNE